MRIILLVRVWTYHVNRALDRDSCYPGHRCWEERRYRGPSASSEHLRVGGQPPVIPTPAPIKSSYHKINLKTRTLFVDILDFYDIIYLFTILRETCTSMTMPSIIQTREFLYFPLIDVSSHLTSRFKWKSLWRSQKSTSQYYRSSIRNSTWRSV